MGRVQEPWFRTEKQCWYVWHKGKQVRLHPKKTEAYRLWHELVSAPAGQITIADAAREFIEEARRRVKPTTLVVYKNILDQLPQSASLCGFDAKSWLEKKEGWSRSYRFAVCSNIKALYEYAAKKGYVEKNPFAEWSVPGIVSRGAKAVVSEKDHEALMKVAPPCYRDALTFLWYTGCRPSEMCRITAGDHKDGVVVLGEHKSCDRTSQPRIVVLCREAREIIERRAITYPAGKIFRTTREKPLCPATLHSWLEPHVKRMGLTVTPYGYRHAYATTALANGVPDAIVAQLLGHASTSMVHKHYSHLTARMQALKDAANKVRGGEGDQKEK